MFTTLLSCLTTQKYFSIYFLIPLGNSDCSQVQVRLDCLLLSLYAMCPVCASLVIPDYMLDTENAMRLCTECFEFLQTGIFYVYCQHTHKVTDNVRGYSVILPGVTLKNQMAGLKGTIGGACHPLLQPSLPSTSPNAHES